MFRTVRGFLALAPALFVAVLAAYLSTRPHAAESFVLYPFLAGRVEQELPRGAVARFSIVATFAFLGPYLVSGLLLLLSDLGLSAAGALWRGRHGPKDEGPRRMPVESLATPLAVSFAAAVAAGLLLHRVAGGGELPGGVNVAPAFVAAVPFAALGAGFALAWVASIPRALVVMVRGTRGKGQEAEPIISG